jgi:hypothetical protein
VHLKNCSKSHFSRDEPHERDSGIRIEFPGKISLFLYLFFQQRWRAIYTISKEKAEGLHYGK